jgi:hypothetical protein
VCVVSERSEGPFGLGPNARTVLCLARGGQLVAPRAFARYKHGGFDSHPAQFGTVANACRLGLPPLVRSVAACARTPEDQTAECEGESSSKARGGSTSGPRFRCATITSVTACKKGG